MRILLPANIEAEIAKQAEGMQPIMRRILLQSPTKWNWDPQRMFVRNRPKKPIKTIVKCIHLGSIINSKDADGQYRICSGTWLFECNKEDEKGELKYEETRVADCRYAEHCCFRCPDYVAAQVESALEGEANVRK